MILHPIFYKFDPCFGFFLVGVKIGPMFTDFLCKIHPFGQHISVYLMWEEKSPPPGPSCRGTQTWFHLFMECIVMRILQSNCGKGVGKGHLSNTLSTVVGKGHLFERVILAGTLEWRGTLRVPPQPGCPTWAHRSYATESKFSKDEQGF